MRTGDGRYPHGIMYGQETLIDGTIRERRFPTQGNKSELVNIDWMFLQAG